MNAAVERIDGSAADVMRSRRGHATVRFLVAADSWEEARAVVDALPVVGLAIRYVSQAREADGRWLATVSIDSGD